MIMTQREFYELVANGNITDEVVAKAAELLEKLDAANAAKREKAAEKSAEKAAEKEPLRQAILAVMTKEPQAAPALIEAAGIDCKVQGFHHLIKPFVEDGTVVKSDVKGEKGKVKGYALAE